MTSFSYDEIAEKSVLGALLLGDQSAMVNVKTSLSSSDFYLQRHRCIFDAIMSLSEMGQAIDLVSVQEELVRQGHSQKVGGIRFLAGLFDALPLSINIDDYMKTIRLCALWRRSLPFDH